MGAASDTPNRTDHPVPRLTQQGGAASRAALLPGIAAVTVTILGLWLYLAAALRTGMTAGFVVTFVSAVLLVLAGLALLRAGAVRRRIVRTDRDSCAGPRLAFRNGCGRRLSGAAGAHISDSAPTPRVAALCAHPAGRGRDCVGAGRYAG